MKLTRKQLRRLIAEAFKQKVPLFDPVSQAEIDAIRQKGRQDADFSNLSPGSIPKLKALDQSGVPASINQARSLYSTLGSTEPEISVEQEQDFLDAQDDYLVNLQDYNIEQALDDVFINGNRDPKLLKQLGFVRLGDHDPDHKQYLLKMNSYMYEQFKYVLNKPIDDLIYIEHTHDMWDHVFQYLGKNKRIVGGYPTMYIISYSVDGKIIALRTALLSKETILI